MVSKIRRQHTFVTWSGLASGTESVEVKCVVAWYGGTWSICGVVFYVRRYHVELDERLAAL